eukprot:12521040-Prorocentrum_lima.AAC.1
MQGVTPARAKFRKGALKTVLGNGEPNRSRRQARVNADLNGNKEHTEGVFLTLLLGSPFAQKQDGPVCAGRRTHPC